MGLEGGAPELRENAIVRKIHVFAPPNFKLTFKMFPRGRRVDKGQTKAKKSRRKFVSQQKIDFSWKGHLLLASYVGEMERTVLKH
jgi:hypothetical protein